MQERESLDRMNVKKEKCCSVCLRAAENGYEIIDNSTNIMLDVLTIELDWDLREELYLCGECAEVTRQSYEFKVVTSDTISSLSVKMRELGTNQTSGSSKSTVTDILVEYTTCGLCMHQVKSDEGQSIDVLLNQSNIMELYPRCMADIDFDDIKDAMICMPCKGKFKDYFKFVSSYLNVKEKENTCFKNGDFNCDKDQELLSKTHNFAFGTNTDLPHVSIEINDIKQELDNFEDFEHIEVSCQPPLLKVEEVTIKMETGIENMDCKDSSQDSIFESTNFDLQTQRPEPNHNSNSQDVLLKISNTIKTYKCDSCTFETKYECNLKTHVLHIHRSNTEVKMYKCQSCAYESKYKGNLKKHKLNHMTISDLEMYKCKYCIYKSKRKSNLNKHMLIHKDISEVKMYKCERCTFETKYKYSLDKHILTHKSTSEVEIYKCDTCTFESKFKGTVQGHMLTHKSVSEVRMYKCEMCTFETKRKKDLTRHILTHKSISEVKTYNCESCTFRTKHKRVLNRHMLTHKNISEVKAYKCESCIFRTKRKSDLNRHMLTHNTI